jgi:signal transduction histidine kinase
MKAIGEWRNVPSQELDYDAYLVALDRYIRGRSEPALRQAQDIGQTALSEGVGLLTLARMHQTSLQTLLHSSTLPEELAQRLSAAAEFFAECISPYEKSYHCSHEANAALRHFNDALEAEAERLAHELHREAGQLLIAVYISLSELAQNSPPQTQIHIAKIVRLLDQIDGQLRRIAHELRPTVLDNLGLLPALRYLSEGMSQRAGLTISVDGTEERWPRLVESVLYRIAQESLNNVVKHSRASCAWIRVEKETGGVRCTIRDNGVGFDVRAVDALDGEHGFGLKGIRERLAMMGGTLQINSAAGRGTELVICVPADSE